MFDPAWGPDSAQIAFSWDGAIEKGKEVGRTMGIYAVNRDGSGLRKIIDAGDRPAAVFNPTWSPTGMNSFTTRELVESETSSKSLWDGGVPEQLTRRQADNFNADWFDPAFALPVSPQPSLLTTTWGKLKTQD